MARGYPFRSRLLYQPDLVLNVIGTWSGHGQQSAAPGNRWPRLTQPRLLRLDPVGLLVVDPGRLRRWKTSWHNLPPSLTLLDMHRPSPDSVNSLVTWAMAALTSAERVLRSDRSFGPWSVRSTDAALMLLALRNVERAAVWVADELRAEQGSRVDNIVATFHSYLPGMVDARDALEHFDEYSRGKGRLQRGNHVRYDFHLVSEQGREVVTVGPLSLDVEHARNA